MCAEAEGRRGKRKVLVFGEEDDDFVSGYMSAKRSVLCDALEKLFKWSVERGDTRLVRRWPTAITPEKAVVKGKGGNSAAAPDRKEDFLVLLCCHLANDSTFEGFVDNFTRKDRYALEDKGFSREAMWYRQLAADMIDEDFKDDHGNAISLPVNHAKDTPPAPTDLFEALDAVDLGRTKRELRARFEDDTEPLRLALRQWLRYLAAEHGVSTVA